MEITSNGRPIAHLLPVAPHPLATLIESGLVQPASGALDLEVTPADEAATTGDPGSEGVAGQVQRDREHRV